MAWQDAVQDEKEGCTLLLEASPGAKQASFPSGYNGWRGRIGIAVRAVAQDGKANQEVAAAVADFFSVPIADVALVGGATDRRKRVRIRGLPADQARARLEAHL